MQTLSITASLWSLCIMVIAFPQNQASQGGQLLDSGCFIIDGVECRDVSSNTSFVRVMSLT